MKRDEGQHEFRRHEVRTKRKGDEWEGCEKETECIKRDGK